MKASIIYNSHSGTTRAFAREIGEYLSNLGIENRVGSINNYDRDYLQKADLVFLGSWTSGLFFIAQHPDKPWDYFAREMLPLNGKRVILFTTYKLATGSMFRKMEKSLRGKIDQPVATIKSKTRKLTEDHKKILHSMTS